MYKKVSLLFLLLITLQTNAQCWTAIKSARLFAIGLKSDGTIWRLSNHPQQIGTDDDWVYIDTGIGHVAALKEDGTLWLWGQNDSGQMGDGTIFTVGYPNNLGQDNDWVFVACGANHTLAIKSDGTLWSWGANSSGQLGHDSSPYPVQVGTDTDWQSAAGGSNHSIAIKTDGTIWAWGLNSSGQLGNGTSPYYGQEGHIVLVPQQVGADSDWQFVSAGEGDSAAIKNDGTLWTWGANGYGQLGDGTNTKKTLPIQIGSDEWKYVSLAARGSFSAFSGGIKEDGSLWMWGYNSNGQLGTGDTTDSNVPVQIAPEGFEAVSCGGGFTTALQEDNTAMGWGANNLGQIGNNDSNVYYTMTPITCEVLSLEKQKHVDFKLYPNPVQEVLYLSQNAGGLSIDKITIADVTGKIICEQYNAHVINVQDLKGGLYFAIITCGSSTSTYKFIKS